MIISLSGVDGSGKTTIAKELVDYFNKTGRPSKYFYLGNYFLITPLVKLLHVVAGRKEGRGTNPFLTTSHKNPLLQLWLVFSLFDNTFNYLRLKFFSRMGFLVITDRYFYDKLIGFQYHGYSGPILSRLYLKLTPAPDIAFVFDQDERISQKREVSGPHALGFYKEIRNRYNRLIKTIHPEKISVGSKTRRRVIQEILEITNRQEIKRGS